MGSLEISLDPNSEFNPHEFTLTQDSEYYTNPHNVFLDQLRSSSSGVSASDVLPTTDSMPIIAVSTEAIPVALYASVPEATGKAIEQAAPVGTETSQSTKSKTDTEQARAKVDAAFGEAPFARELAAISGELTVVSTDDLPPMEADTENGAPKPKKHLGQGKVGSYRGQRPRGRRGKGKDEALDQPPTAPAEEVLMTQLEASMKVPDETVAVTPVIEPVLPAAVLPPTSDEYISQEIILPFSGEQTSSFFIDTDAFIPKVVNVPEVVATPVASAAAPAPKMPDFKGPAPSVKPEAVTEEFEIKEGGEVVPRKGRLKRLMEKSGDASRAVYARATTIDVFEARRQKRTKIITGLLGVAAVGKVGFSLWAASKGMSAGGGTSYAMAEQLASQLPPIENIGIENVEIVEHASFTPLIETPASLPIENLPAENPAPTTHVLASGENPWNVSEDILIARGDPAPTPPEIAAFNDQMLAASNISPEQANTLPVGFELTVPGEATGTEAAELPSAPPSTHALAPGENPWVVAKNHLLQQGNAAPSISQIDDLTDQILVASNVPPEQSENLPVGFELTIPGAPAPEETPTPEPVPAPEPEPTPVPDVIPPLSTIEEFEPLHPEAPLPHSVDVEEVGYWEHYATEYAPSDGIVLASLIAVGGIHRGVERKLSKRRTAKSNGRLSAKDTTRPGGSTKQAPPTKSAAKSGGKTKYGTHGKKRVK